MNNFKEEALVKFSIPLYAVLIGLEMILSFFHDKHYYSKKGLLANIYLSSLNFGLDVLMRTACLFMLGFFYQYHLYTIENVYAYWIVLLILQDFMFYWLHRVDHYCRLFWAVHVTHHSSEEFNLTVGFRSSVFQPLYRFI